MSKPFDAATKYLIDLSPRDWLAAAGERLEPDAVLEPFDADLSTVSADADRLIRLSNVATPCVYHIELQASYDARFDERVFRYNALTRYEYRLPVRSIAFLLRKAADGSRITGGLREGSGVHELRFAYSVVRVWEQDAQALLRGGLAALPLAPLAAKNEAEAAAVVQAVQQRLDTEADLNKARELSTATFTLLGLNYGDAFIETLTKGLLKMKESSFYQKILREGRSEGVALGRSEGVALGRDEGMLEGMLLGRVQEAQNLLLLQGTRRFGVPTPEQRAQIESTTAREQLEIWLLSLLDAPDWNGVFR